MIPQKVHLYTAPSWKAEAIRCACEMQIECTLEVGTLIKKLMANPEFKCFGKEIPKFVQKIIPEFKSGSVDRYEIFTGPGIDEYALLKESISFLEKEIGCSVEVYSADSPAFDPEKKSRFAEPLRPAIYIEQAKTEE
jgi:leucyl-tRNA synthetase